MEIESAAVEVVKLQSPEDITKAFDTFLELTRYFTDSQSFVQQVLRQQKEGYQIVAIFKNAEVVAAMGFRLLNTLVWGKILYIDDLVTKQIARKRGFGTKLLDYAVEQANVENCKQVHLDSGYHRIDAHRLYLNYGFTLNCHHFGLILTN